jgi:hypothetical protein
VDRAALLVGLQLHILIGMAMKAATRRQTWLLIRY